MVTARRESKEKGFTLLEILLVVAAMAILAAVVIVAINPGKQLADTRNAQRHSDVQTILNAVYHYSVDNDGDLPATITGTATDICTTGGDCTGLIDLGVLTTNQTYLVSMPEDPSEATANSTDYQIVQSTNGRVTVSAPGAEEGETIEVSK